MNRFRTYLIGALLAVLAIASPALAQTTLNSTTLSASVTDRQLILPLAAVTNIALKDWLFFDAEFAQVNAIDTTAKTVTVKRGNQGSAGRAHASGVLVWTGPPPRFYGGEVAGSCTASLEQYLPHIVIGTKNLYDCLSGEWVRFRIAGHRDVDTGRSDGATTYTALGAITVQPGLVFINGTTLAMTIIDPTLEQNGMTMMIVSTNASAQTLTYTAGFGGGTTARDVATFGGAVNDNIVIIAFNKVWWVLSTRNVTLG